MVIMHPGAYPDTAFPDRYWIDNYWADHGVSLIMFRGIPTISIAPHSDPGIQNTNTSPDVVMISGQEINII